MNVLISLLKLKPLSFHRRGLKFIFSLLLGFSLLVLFLLFTPLGAKYSFQFISKISPLKIHFTDVKGCLAYHLEIEDFELISPMVETKAKNISLTWQLRSLFDKEWHINTLNISHLSLKIKTIEGKAAPTFAKLQDSLKAVLPFPIQIDNSHIQNADIYWQNEKHHVEELIINQASSVALANIVELYYQGSFGKIHAFLHDKIKIIWDIKLPKSPLFAQYFSSDVVTSGKIFLPNRKIKDPQNQVHIELKAKNAHLAEHKLEEVWLKIEGTLPSHTASLNALIEGSPIAAKITGKLLPYQWEGKISQFETLHPRFKKIGNLYGKLDINWQQKNVLSHLQLLLWEKYPLTIDLSASKKKPYVLSGKLKTQIENIQTLNFLFARLKDLSGNLTVDLAFQGLPSQLEWTGDIQLNDAKLRTAQKNNAVLNQLHFILHPKELMTITGMGTWGDGSFKLTGQGNWHPSHPTLSLNLKGEELLLSNTPEYYILANPDLTLTIQEGKPTIEGKIFIPHAEIQSLKTHGIIQPNEDVVIISTKSKTTQSPQKVLNQALTKENLPPMLTTKVELILGNKISYKGFGFNTFADGKIRVTQFPGTSFKAKGKLSLRNGKYRAYGKKFDIDYGQILFTGGPINDPVLDIHVQRKIENKAAFGTLQAAKPVTAGIKFSGRLKNPKIGFYSDPTMNDADVMSYLIVGRPQNQMTEAQSELLFEAVSQLASIVGNSREDVNFDLAEKLKLDQLGFAKRETKKIKTSNSHPLEDTVLVLGKQLSSHLYLHYSLGLVDSANNFGLRYLLSKNVTLEAQAGTQGTSADVLLSFEGK